MNDVLVSVEPSTGTLRRYVVGYGEPLLTHSATLDKAATFTVGSVEGFRTHPPEQFRIQHEPHNPPPPAGGTPVAARIAA